MDVTVETAKFLVKKLREEIKAQLQSTYLYPPTILLQLESPPYPMLLWFTDIQNIFIILSALLTISLLSIGWLWEKREEIKEKFRL